MTTPGAPGTAANPLPPDTPVTEPKVKWGTSGAGAGAVVAAAVDWALSTYAFHGNDVPGPVQALVFLVAIAVLPVAGAWVAGRAAPHQFRLNQLQHNPGGPVPRSNLRHRSGGHSGDLPAQDVPPPGY